MAEMIPQEADSDADSKNEVLKEHEKLDLLLSQIPKKAQHGLMMSCDLVLTCIDANSEYIALGTNVGRTFLYSRKDHVVQRLKALSTNDVITSVKLHHGIDDQLAAGTASGDISVFCIPGLGSTQKKEIQKFEVKGLHEHYITCLEWSTNGMKLYSGDKSGQVVATELDFYVGECFSSVLLVEPSTEIVQLDYKHKALLVSTRHRSFIVRIDLKCQVTNVGEQDRKVPGHYGACFVPGLCKTDDAQLYAARPGCRLWLSDMKGIVCNTLIFSDPLSPAIPEISLLNTGKLQLSVTDFQFSRLKWFEESQLVTWSSSALLVLDPSAKRVVARQNRLSGIVDLAVTEEGEIFVLRRHAEARVIRIAKKAEMRSVKDMTKPLSIVAPEVKEAAKKKQKEEQEDPSQGFFMKKLGNPFKKLLHDFKKEEEDVSKEDEIPEAAVSDISPELPPVVKLASPELEKVRVFTASPDPATGVGPETACHRSSEPSSVPSSSEVPPSDPAYVPVITVEGTPSSPWEGTTCTADAAEVQDDIVFSHRMKKHKKKKRKQGLGMYKEKEKDEDSLSQASASSNVSDEMFPSQPQNTPVGDKSCLDALRKADEILQLVSNTISKDASASMESPKTVLGSSDKCQGAEDFDKLKNGELRIDSADREGLGKDESEKVKGEISGEKGVEPSVLSDEEVKFDQSSLAETDQHSKERVSDTKGSCSDVKEIQAAKPETDEDLSCFKINQALDSIEKFGDMSTQAAASAEANKQSKRHSASLRHDSYQDIYKEIEAIESTDPFGKGQKQKSSADDFYSKFQDSTPESPIKPPPEDYYLLMEKNFETAAAATAERSREMADIALRRVANSWSEFHTRTNIYSLVVSKSHAWFTDKSENINYSSIAGPKGIQWRRATEQASQISVSPSGAIVWRLHRHVVYAGTKINSRHPEGLKWVEAVREVSWISVDNNCAWYIKKTGEVMMQRGLSAERPCFKSKPVECSHKLRSILCRYGIVWAITEGLRLLVRAGVSAECPEGTHWILDSRETPPYLFFCVAIDNENVGWAIDVLGQIWFCVGVTRENPMGSNHWWQVPLGGYVLQDESTLDVIKSLARNLDPLKLSSLLSTNRGGLITAGEQGVWIAMDYRNVLQVCRGSLQGFHWLEAQPAQMSASTTWRNVCASISDLDWGLVWAQHTNGDMFVFKEACSEASMLSHCDEFSHFSVGPTATWALTPNGEVMVRAGMGAHCPQGTGWVNIDLSQLGDVLLVHLSCNSLYVWAVESEGGVYQRIGARPPSDTSLNPVWLPIDSFAEIVFTRVHTGPLDWMVWTIDNRRLTYVRTGITESMPIGQEWVHVPGIQSVDLALTRSGVWALNPQGEVFFRYGITRTEPCGNYWKKIPGTFIKISASANDELWGINTEGQLMKCSLKMLLRRQDSSDPLIQGSVSTATNTGEDQDWEMI